MTNRPSANDEKDGEMPKSEDDHSAVLPPIENFEADEDQSDYLGDRIRDRFGLSLRQWELLVSVVVFLPYPFFVALILTGMVQSLEFLLFTLVYSVLAIYVNLVL